MSRTTTVAVIVGVVIVVALGAWFLAGRGTTMPSQTSSVPEGSVPSGSAAPGASSDSSDAAMERDMATIDAQFEALGSDSAAVDQSLNDEPVPQENP